MPMPSIRILIADDSGLWRAQVRKLLHERPDWQIAGEADDGQQAVQHASELRPDLIILDIQMPVLNGIEAGKQILRVFPSSKIIFLSQYVEPEIIEQALAAGAVGYVVKAHAARELFPTIEAAIRDGNRAESPLTI